MARHSLSPIVHRSVLGSDPFVSLQQGMNRLFDEVFHGAGMSLMRDDGGMLMPQVNVSETDKEIRVTAELPGVERKDVDVTLDDDMLTIRGEKKLEKTEDKEDYHFSERSFGRFQRSIRIPHSVNREQVQAHVEHGVLTVILPKNQAQEKTRHIEVKDSH